MKILKQIQSYINKQYQMLKDNQAEVEKSNTQLAHAILIMGCLSFLPFIAISFVIPEYFALRTAYLVAFFCLIFVLFGFKIIGRYLSFATVVYSTYSLLIAYSIYTSALITPDFNSVIILLFLFQLPIIVIDKSWRVDLVTVIYAVIYLLLAIPYKNPRLVADEILNCLLFTMLGIGLGEILRYARLENFELKRLVTIREKTDDLTGLHNRKSLFEYLNKLSSNSTLCLFLIDIDYFKAFNDTYGHQAGDECLKMIGRCFIDFGMENQFEFFRYGGEEFVGVTTQHDPSEFQLIAQKLNQAVLDLNISHNKTQLGMLSISIGIDYTESFLPGDETYLLSQADTAMYVAKSQGRNRFVQYNAGMSMEQITKKEYGH